MLELATRVRETRSFEFARTGIVTGGRLGGNVSPEPALLFTLVPCVLAALAGPPAPSVASWTLEELVRFSDRIVVGRVERVGRVPCDPSPTAEAPIHPFALGALLWTNTEVPIAEVAVERTLHGPHSARVHYLAVGTWTCDTTTTIVGERVLLFLSDTRWAGDAGARLEAALTELTGGAPVFQDAHSGYGRMPLRELEGRTFADIDVGAAVPPESLATVKGPVADDKQLRSAPLDALVEYVVRTSAQVLPSVRASLCPAGDDPACYEVSTWADGVSFVHGDDIWLRDPIEASTWRIARTRLLGEGLAAQRLLAGSLEHGERGLSYLDAHTSWRLAGPALDPAHEWTGPERPLVLRARAQWNALVAAARAASRTQR